MIVSFIQLNMLILLPFFSSYILIKNKKDLENPIFMAKFSSLNGDLRFKSKSV